MSVRSYTTSRRLLGTKWQSLYNVGMYRRWRGRCFCYPTYANAKDNDCSIYRGQHHCLGCGWCFGLWACQHGDCAIWFTATSGVTSCHHRNFTTTIDTSTKLDIHINPHTDTHSNTNANTRPNTDMDIHTNTDVISPQQDCICVNA